MTENQHQEDITHEEIKKDFELERMTLFSDAVFAIVITLVAIEIKLPESAAELTNDNLLKILAELMPTILAYALSFLFIGSIWYKHLKIFSLLKDYDKGLVFRNLLLLFFIGLFPFAASLITKTNDQNLSFFFYLLIAILCLSAQYTVNHYILISKPQLRINTGIEKEMINFKKSRLLLILFAIGFVLSSCTYFFISDPEMKRSSILFFVGSLLIYRIIIKKKYK